MPTPASRRADKVSDSQAIALPKPPVFLRATLLHFFVALLLSFARFTRSQTALE
jgi:hypothetical protein